MAKITRVGGRGTTRRKTDTSKKSTFSGDSYKEYQEAKKKAAGNRSVFYRSWVREKENYHQLQQQKKHLLKVEHAQLVEVLVVEKQKVNPLNLFSFIHLLCLFLI